MTKRRILGVLLGGAIFCASASASANLITNGSFESPVVPIGSFTNFSPGSNLLTGWAVVDNSVSVVSGDFAQLGISFPAQDGAQWLDLTGFGVNSVEGVAQTIPTTIGHTYRLSFYVGNVSGSVFGVASTIDTFLNGGLAFTDTNDTPGTTQNWEQFIHEFVADSALTTILFRNADAASDNSNGLDNIVLLDLGRVGVPAVPEPGALGLLALSVAGVGLMRTRARSGERRSSLRAP